MLDLVRFYRWILSDWFKIQYFRCWKTCKNNFWKNRFLKAYCSTFKNHGSRSQKKIFSKIDFRPKNGPRCFQITLKNSSTPVRTPWQACISAFIFTYWLDSDLIPRLLENFENWKNFMVILLSVKNDAYRRFFGA